jgi:alpha/beta hydrolase fold
MSNTIPKPSQWQHITEFIRSFFETIKGFFYLLITTKEDLGKGKPVLVVPGLLSSDISTYVLRKYLTKKGYIVYGWQLGINLGRMEKLPELVSKIEYISTRHHQPIILIGWSMGGLFSREVCHQHPEFIAKVVTLGSPFADLHAPNNARWVFELLNSKNNIDDDISTRLASNTVMPSVAIYSKSDGIVPWQACMDVHTDQQHINIEVASSHFGMGANPKVLQAILQSF